eukprot:150902-Amphidinium_carterae.1
MCSICSWPCRGRYDLGINGSPVLMKERTMSIPILKGISLNHFLPFNTRGRNGVPCFASMPKRFRTCNQFDAHGFCRSEVAGPMIGNDVLGGAILNKPTEHGFHKCQCFAEAVCRGSRTVTEFNAVAVCKSIRDSWAVVTLAHPPQEALEIQCPRPQ